MELPTGQLAFTFRRCENDDADIRLLTLPSGDITSVLQSEQDDREPAWAPDGQRLAILSYAVNERTLCIVDLSKLDMCTEIGSFVYQFAWSPDGASLFYLNREEDLYQYNFANGESEHIISAVSGFSVSPNGQWLGLSIRNPTYSGAFVFRVLDLNSGRLLTTVDRNDIGRLGSNSSVWSPTTDEVAVLFGTKVNIYTIQRDYLDVKATVDVRDTYQRDFGQDLVSAAFGRPVWSLDGQRLLVIRFTTDAKLGGEVLLFDAALSNYQRLPFGDNVTEVVWTTDGKWLTYVTSNGGRNTSSSCADFFRGEIWLADMETLKTQVVVTDAFSIYPPAWRP